MALNQRLLTITNVTQHDCVKLDIQSYAIRIDRVSNPPSAISDMPAPSSRNLRIIFRTQGVQSRLHDKLRQISVLSLDSSDYNTSEVLAEG